MESMLLFSHVDDDDEMTGKSVGACSNRTIILVHCIERYGCWKREQGRGVILDLANPTCYG